MIIGKRFYIDAAHLLPNHQGKCKNLHGHTWIIDIEIEGPLDQHFGWVMDFKDFSEVVNSAIDHLDHQILNNFLPNPTCENLVEYIKSKLGNYYLEMVRSIKIQEGKGGWARYEKM